MAKLPHVSAVDPALPSRDGGTALITVRYEVPVTDLTPDETVGNLRDATSDLARSGNQVEFGGQVPENVTAPDGAAEAVGVVAALVVTPAYGPQDERATGVVDRIRADVLPPGSEITGLTAAYVDLSRMVDERLWPVIGAVVATSFLMLMIVFRSLLVPLKAAAMNLLSIGAAYGALTAIFQWGWGAELLGLPHSVPVSTLILLLMFAVLFGVSMDYEVFLLSRIREEWLRTGDARASVPAGLAATGRVITSAALIMVAVFLGFALDPGLVVKQMGVGLAVAVALDATVVRLVLVPATMALLGRANWWLPPPLGRILPTFDPQAPASSPPVPPRRSGSPAPPDGRARPGG